MEVIANDFDNDATLKQKYAYATQHLVSHTALEEITIDESNEPSAMTRGIQAITAGSAIFADSLNSSQRPAFTESVPVYAEDVLVKAIEEDDPPSLLQGYYAAYDQFPDLEPTDIAWIYYHWCRTLVENFAAASPEDRQAFADENQTDVNEMMTKLQDKAHAERHLEMINRYYSEIRDLPEFEKTANLFEPLSDVEFDTEYRNWVRTLETRLVTEAQSYAMMVASQERLQELNPVSASIPLFEALTFSIGVRILRDEAVVNNRVVKSVADRVADVEEGIEIFNQSRVSPEIPFIVYNDHEGNPYHKIYNNMAKAHAKDQTVFFEHLYQFTRASTIYLLIWVDELGSENIDPNRRITGSQHNSFVKAIYYIDIGVLHLPVPDRSAGIQAMRDSLAYSLPRVELGSHREIRLHGHFDVDDVPINEVVLHYLMINDPLFETYLEIDESKNPRCDKPRLNIHYRDPSRNQEGRTAASVSISLGPFVADANAVVQAAASIDPSVHRPLPQHGRYRINIRRAESVKVLYQFLNVFLRLLSVYAEIAPSIEAYLEQIIPGSTHKQPLVITSPHAGPNAEVEAVDLRRVSSRYMERSSRRSVVEDSKIRILKTRAPDLIKSGYARRVQCKMQPILILPDEVEDWRNYLVHNRNVAQLRQVMPFPPPLDEDGNVINPVDPENLINPMNHPEVMYWVVCPTNALPYPNLVVSHKKGSLYPWFPSCTSRSMLDNTTNRKSPYYMYYDKDALAARKNGSSESYHMQTSKILPTYGRIGVIGNVLTRLLQIAYGGAQNTREVFNRFGVPIGPNSLIHCVYTAVQDPVYASYRTNEERENFAQQFREYCAYQLSPLICSQEMYDRSFEEIQAILLNPEEEFASELFYRYLEVELNINIFVFDATTDQKQNNNGSVEEALHIEVPRSKLMHIRPLREHLPTILIYKHWGAEVDKLEYKHCELVVATSESIIPHAARKKLPVQVQSHQTRHFGSAVTRAVYSTMLRANQSIIWTFPHLHNAPNRDDEFDPNQLISRVNSYSYVDWYKIFEGYTLFGQRVDQYGKLRVLGVQLDAQTRMCVHITPSQPLNLPVLQEITNIAESRAIEIFGLPSAYGEEGVWFSIIDFKYGVYVPTSRSYTRLRGGGRTELPTTHQSDNEDEDDEEEDDEDEEEENLTPIVQVNFKTNIDPLQPEIIEPHRADPHEASRRFENSQNILAPISIHPLTAQKSDDQLINLCLRSTSYLVQLIRWLWRLSPERHDLRAFWTIYVRQDASVSSDLAETKMSQYLPRDLEVHEAIAWLATRWPQFFASEDEVNYCVRLYPILYDRLYFFFSDEERQIVGLSDSHPLMKPAVYLKDVYKWESDFLSQKDTMLFVNRKHLISWINESSRDLHSSSGVTLVHPRAEAGQIYERDPYIYLNPTTNRIFIIQNVQNFELGRVLALCETWAEEGRNIGFNIDEAVDPLTVSYVVYTIAVDGTMIQIEDHRLIADEVNYFHVLRYVNTSPEVMANHRYAAMIPIL